jgi:hypothetical protein
VRLAAHRVALIGAFAGADVGQTTRLEAPGVAALL